MCDVYVYADVQGGWTTHVAAKRHVEKAPDFSDPKMPLDEWMEASKRRDEWFDAAEIKQIGLEFDGETFSDDTPKECAERLLRLRETGYNVPQYAVDALMEEE